MKEGKRLKVKIDRARWLRGDGNGTLLDGAGNMCCLGFVCRALGYTDEQLLNIGTPSGLTDPGLAVDAGLAAKSPKLLCETRAADRAINNNDYEDYEKEEEREADIKSILRSIGIDVEFIGEGNPCE